MSLGAQSLSPIWGEKSLDFLFIYLFLFRKHNIFQ